MTREERHALLGPEIVAWIEERAKAAPKPSTELVRELRRIMANPGGPIPVAQPVLAPASRAA